MAKYTGMALVVAFNSGAWGANFVRSATVEDNGDLVDSSGVGDTAKTKLFVQSEGTATIEMIADSSNTTIDAIFAMGASSTLDIYPDGNSTGKQKITGTAIVSKRSLPTVYNQLVLRTFTLEYNGAITYTNA